VLRREAGGWRSRGQVTSGAVHLAIGEDVWAWSEAGMWVHRGGPRWRQVSDHPVVAAAARGPTIAATDGAAVWFQRREGRRRLMSTLPGVRQLAWQGTVLWAIADGGLQRSGGAVLPWLPSFEDLTDVAVIAGSGNRMWMVLEDGLLVQSLRVPCPSSWQGGGGAGGLAQPRGVAASGRGWFVVADTQHHRVRWYARTGSCLDSFGEEGQLPGQFKEPSGVALADDGTVAVADTWNGRIQLLRPDGTVQMVGGDLYGPRGVLWHPDGSLLVADTGNKLLLRFRPPRWTREELYRFDGPVVGLAWVDASLAAAVPALGKAVLFNPDTWRPFRELEVPGWSSGEQQEGYLVRTAGGGLLASAPQPGELWLLDPSGVTGPRLVEDNLEGATGLATLPDGQVLVSLTWENRLERIDIEE
jgi:sugar lactone lactonase YvrE